MSASSFHPTLRLVNPEEAGRRQTLPGRDAAGPVTGVGSGAGAGVGRGGPVLRAPSIQERNEDRIARENRAAAGLSALDCRWVLAVQAARELQGGRAGIITPEGRRRLLVVGNRLGLRAFDANLIIAIVQDGARCGEDPLGTSATERLRLVAPEAEFADVQAAAGGAELGAGRGDGDLCGAVWGCGDAADLAGAGVGGPGATRWLGDKVTG